jgi:ABC-2 type transport system ATP-binding protein
MSDPLALSLRSIAKTYTARSAPPRCAVDGVSLDLPRGSWTALLGPNGAGKSTLMRIIATVERPDAGEVLIDGSNARSDPRAARARLGMVFQRPGLDPLLTVRENMMLQAALAGLPRLDGQRRVNDLLARIGLVDRADDRVSTLSGGMQRRADLGRALVASPALLLLDEPTGGLDLEARRGFLDLVRRRIDESAGGLTVLMSTHLMDEAERADHVVMMSRGRVAAHGTPAELCAAVGGAGGRVVIAAATDRGVLRALGLDVRVTRGEAVGSGDPEAIEHAARELVRKGVSFRAGTATLADAYLAVTGSMLAGDPDPPGPAPSDTTTAEAAA